jgi:hypothetical protein
MAKVKTKTKTWKLGEICQGGVVTVEVTGQKIAVIGKQWDFSTGSRKSSDQSKAQEFTRLEIEANEYNAERRVIDFLCDLMHSWAADEIAKWIKAQVSYTSNEFW